MSIVSGVRVEMLWLSSPMDIRLYCNGMSRARMNGRLPMLGREGRRSKRRGMRRTG